MTDTKKFWLMTFVYWIVFWILPLQSIWTDKFFGFFNELLSKFNVDIESAILFYLIIVPIAIFLCFIYIKKLNIRYKTIIFMSSYIIIPYISIIAYLFYGLSNMNIKIIF
jgi:hypothetical protein